MAVIQRKRAGHDGIRLALALVAAACALAAIVAAAAAEDATETTTFGRDGIASQSLGVHFEETRFSSVIARADGSLVAQRDQQIEAYLPDGTPDPAGPIRQLEEWGRVFAFASGKSLVVDDGKLTRLNPDGSVDTSFGGTGTIEWRSGVQAASELTSGKILFADAQVVGTHVMFAQLSLELLGPDGSLERGFGHDGTLELELPQNSASTPEIAPTGDGGALVAGDGFLLKLRADGTRDPGFGSDGLLAGLPSLVGARLLADGSVEAVGWTAGRSVEDSDLVVLRFTATGTPDEAFGPEGLRRFDFGGREEANVASWGADGSVVVGGRAEPHGPCPRGQGCEEAPMLAAFDPAGNIDSNFGQGGMLKLTALAGAPSSYPDGGVLALTHRPDGSIVAAGSAAPKRTLAFLAALSPAGVPLPGFGEGGIVRLPRPVPATQQRTGFVPLANGNLLAAASTDLGLASQSVLIRYAADGGLDPTFGGGAGYVTVGGTGVMGLAASAGQVLMGFYDTPRSRLLRLNAADGVPVRSFGTEGVVLLPRRVRRVAALGFVGGDPVVLGIRDVAGTAEPGVVLRFRPNGEPDQEFGHDGRVELRLPGGGEVKGRALIGGPGGRILAGGKSGRRFVVTSLLPDGRPDPHFGSGGWSVVSAGGIAKSVTLSRSGSHLYLAGVAAEEVGRPHVVLMRFGDDGRLDSSFGHRGRLTAPISKPAQPKAIVPTGDGVLVVLSGGPRPLLSFDLDGKVRRDWVGPNPQIVTNVRATVSRGQLVLGWNAFAPAPFRHYVSYLSSRSLGSP